MSYEVEQKFPVADLSVVESRLIELGGGVLPPQDEVDVYFAHPGRDFARTDEALRLRRKADAYYITYKGPKLDATTKTRREIELPLPPGEGTVRSWTELLTALGFQPVAEVHKLRRKAFVPWQGRSIEASLDTVDEVGVFVELELMTEAEGIEAAKASIASLAHALGLGISERRSYLELLLATRL